MQIEFTDQEVNAIFVNVATRLGKIAGHPAKVEARKTYISILRKLSVGFGDGEIAQRIRDQIEAAEEMINGRT